MYQPLKDLMSQIILYKPMCKLSKGTMCLVLIFSSFLFYSCLSNDELEKKSYIPKKYRQEKYKNNPVKNLEFYPIINEKSFNNLKMIGKVRRYGVIGNTRRERLYGSILRVLRYQNISRKVEGKYKIPKNLILAMMMQETGGANLLPNALDDGGVGLCHMQPSVAQEFGLKVYQNCNKLISKKHGKSIRRLIKEYNNKTHQLIKFDDRFHPIKNIDAVGRILAYYRDGKQRESTSIKTAISYYSGRYNFPNYYENVIYYRRMLNSKTTIDAVRKEFNRKNPAFKIDGKKANFDDYILTHQKLNVNFGLNGYK